MHNNIDLLLKREISTNKFSTNLFIEINKKNIDLIKLIKKSSLEQFGITLNSLKDITKLKEEIRELYYYSIGEWLEEQVRSCLREKVFVSGYTRNKSLSSRGFKTLIKEGYLKQLSIRLRPYQHDFMYQQASMGLDLECEALISPLEMAPTEDNPYLDAAWFEIILVGMDSFNKCIECKMGMITGYIAHLNKMIKETGENRFLVGKDEFLSVSHIADEFWVFLNDMYSSSEEWKSLSTDQNEYSSYMLNHIQLVKEFDSIESMELVLKIFPIAFKNIYKRNLMSLFYTPGETELEDFTVGNGIEWPDYLDEIELLMNEFEFNAYGNGRFYKCY